MTVVGELPTNMLSAMAGGVCLTIDELDAKLDLNRSQISDAVGMLVLRGFAERIERGCYQLTKAGIKAAESGHVIKAGPYRPHTGRKPPYSDTLRQRAWTAMRMSRTFTISDLVMAASRPEDTGPEDNLLRYVRYLKRGGYVIELAVRARGTALTSNGFKRFRLVKDAGEIAPVWCQRKGQIVDHNEVAQ